MLKRITTIGIISATLAACGSGSNSGGSARAPVDPNSYGNLQGPTVAYSGPLLPLYTPQNLQAFITTKPSFTALVGGETAFGVCNGIESSTLGQTLCASNLHAISTNPQFSAIFGALPPNTIASASANNLEPDQVNVNNFVTIGAERLGITSVQPYRFIYNAAGAPYQFGGGATNPETVSAVALVPQTASGPLPSSQIKGVVLYFHPTIFSKGGVPSDFDGTLTPNNSPDNIKSNAFSAFIEDGMLAAVYASQGYIVVSADYVGQGIDYKVQHPYVIFAETNAQTGLAALKAARTALASQGVTLPTPAKLYISSYSEGGPYALWASKLAQTSYAGFLADNGFALRRTAGASGAYDLTGATLHYEFANASNSKESSENVWNVSPGLIATNPIFESYVPTARALAALSQAASKSSLAGYVVTALAYYNSSPGSLNVLAPNYSQMKQCLDWTLSTGGGAYPAVGTLTPQEAIVNCSMPLDLAALYNSPGLSATDIINQSFASATIAATGANAFLTGGQTFDQLLTALAGGYTNNSVGSFIEPGILTDPTIVPFIAQQNIQSWTTNSPLDVLFLNYDSTVPNINALEACGNIPNFPGYQPNYMGGVKQLSPAGMVTCVNLPNNGTDSLSALYTQSGGLPLMMDHGQAEAVLQILALNQFTANP